MLLLFFLSTTISIACPLEPPSDQDVKDAMTRWDHWFQMHLGSDADEARVDRLMKGKFRDRAAMHLGGNGDRAVFYLIDDYIQIGFGFDVKGRLNYGPVVQRKGAWLKDPDGNLMYIPK